ncbi:MAG: tRNA-dihydrouridine synthase [Treponema sp.]|nr:tRNA-dihydrouridine synthase [Treponema sp.]
MIEETNLYRPLRIGSLELPGNLFLAPVAGYTDRVFRSICAEHGADFSFTELASAEAIARGAKPSLDLVRRGDHERRYAIQLFGANPETLYKAALALAPFGPEAVDLNCGCPVPKVIKHGAGSALMKDPPLLGRIVEALVKASSIALGGAPVTVKMRSGWDSQSINYRECSRIAVEAGAAMVSLHCRTRAQGYHGRGDWTHIADLASRLKVPVCGSGDLFYPADAQRMLRETGCGAVMFARGAEGNPFIFPATRALLQASAAGPAAAGLADASPAGMELADTGLAVSLTERTETAFRHLCLLAADIGEGRACKEMRKQFCAYIKGPPGSRNESGSAALRNRLVKAETIADYRTILGMDEGRTQ